MQAMIYVCGSFYGTCSDTPLPPLLLRCSLLFLFRVSHFKLSLDITVHIFLNFIIKLQITYYLIHISDDFLLFAPWSWRRQSFVLKIMHTVCFQLLLLITLLINSCVFDLSKMLRKYELFARYT